MTKAAVRKPAFRCSDCGASSLRWVGRCGECQAWGTVSELGAAPRSAVRAGPVTAPARPIADLDPEVARARPTGVAELDRVLGGGLVPGSVVLLAGEPGVGKSTLLLEVAHRFVEDEHRGSAEGERRHGVEDEHRGSAEGERRHGVEDEHRGSAEGERRHGVEDERRHGVEDEHRHSVEDEHRHNAQGGQRALIVTGEESAAQVRLRAERTGSVHPNLFLAAENDLAAVLTHLDDVRPGLLVVDSVQTISTDASDGSAGGVPQIRAVAAALIAVAKQRGIATVLVGHVTKDGSIAGPRVLEHLVDVVLHFEGERHSTLRLIRATKNRFGAADEVGCFEMREDGIVGLADPSGLFLSERGTAVAGTCVTVILEGRRPLVTEVQALVNRSPGGGSPRRAVSDLDSARVAMLIAVLSRHGGVSLSEYEVYAATVGGIAAHEPAADLAILLALWSARNEVAVPSTVCAIGEVSLSGDVRRVGGLGRRLAEAARLGFEVALVPAGHAGAVVEPAAGGIRTIPVATLGQARVALADAARGRPVDTARRRPADGARQRPVDGARRPALRPVPVES